MLNHSNILH